MTDVFDELNELNVPYTLNNKIQVLNFQPFLDKLHTSKTIKTKAILEFMASLKGTNKSGGNNGISRLQTFLNAYAQEMALLSANQNTLQFSKEDHLGLVRGGHGEKDPDFNFYAQDGQIYTIEAKMYWDQKSFEEVRDDTNFHDADYVCLFFIKDSNYRWAFAKKEDNYKKIYRVVDLIETDPQILELRLPNTLTTISFNVDKNSPDTDIPEEVSYNFYNN